VLACDRQHDLGIRAVENIRSDGGDVAFMRADVSNPDDAVRVMDEVERHYRSLDLSW
jgi:NAD(P)-dependent dehydrogenase (short-subunit alcohol dehydrogenase family)